MSKTDWQEAHPRRRARMRQMPDNAIYETKKEHFKSTLMNILPAQATTRLKFSGAAMELANATK